MGNLDLQNLLYEEILKWMHEHRFSSVRLHRFSSVPLYEDDGLLCIKFDDLIRWMDHSQNAKRMLKSKLNDCPTFGDSDTGLILLKYLPCFIASYTPQANAPLRRKIDTLLERFGFMRPETPIEKVYFFEFRATDDYRLASGVEMYCKIGSTKNLIDTRFGSFRQQFRSVAERDTLQCIGSGYIESNDASILEEKIKADLICYHTDIFSDTSIVGKEECYELTSRLRDFLFAIVEKGCYTLPEESGDFESIRAFIETCDHKT